MFKFLKDKLKNAVSKFSEDVSEETQEEVETLEETSEEILETKKNNSKKTKTITDTIEEKNSHGEKLSSAQNLKNSDASKTDVKKEITSDVEKDTDSEEIIEITEEPETEVNKKGFFKKLTEKVTRKNLSDSKFEDLFWEIEIALLESNIAVEVIEKIKQDLKDALVNEKHAMFKAKDIIQDTLKNTISELLEFENIDFNELVKEKKPYIIAFIGVNGVGKTTNLAKLAYKLKNEGKEVVIAACDTFRAAAIQQVEEHANNIGVKLIKHDYGSDAAAVAFDAIEHAKSKGKDFVLIDTAGRNQANSNLMEELKKIIRVTKPDMKIFVGDSLTGNDAVEQAQQFDKAVGIDAIILSKVDADEKGGASVSISYVVDKPIIFIGNGQDYPDLQKFDKQEFLEKMGFD